MSVANLLKMAPPPYRSDKVVLYAATDGYVYVRSSDGTFQLARQSEVTTALTAGLATKAATSHAHTIADTTGLQTALDGKAPLGGTGTVTLGTPTASTSGTSIDFTGIPSGTKRITVTFAGLSTNGAATPMVQLGKAAGIETTGYLGTAGLMTNGSTGQTLAFTTGMGLVAAFGAASIVNGTLVLTLVSTAAFIWVGSTSSGYSNGAQSTHGGYTKTLSAELDRIRITTSNGTDTFDAGTVNVAYEA